MTNQVANLEGSLEASLGRLDEDLDACMRATAEDFKARESAVALRRRMIQLAPTIDPAKWSNPELAKHFDVSGTAISNIRKEAPKHYEDSAYLLGGLIALALTYCGEPEAERTARATASKLLTAEVCTAEELYDLFKGTFDAATRGTGRSQKDHFGALTEWWNGVCICPRQDS